MSITNTFRRVGNKFIETFRPNKGLITNLPKGIEYKAKLEKELGLPESKPVIQSAQDLTKTVDYLESKLEVSPVEELKQDLKKVEKVLTHMTESITPNDPGMPFASTYRTKDKLSINNRYSYEKTADGQTKKTYNFVLSDYKTKQEANSHLLKLWCQSVDPLTHEEYKQGKLAVESSDLPDMGFPSTTKDNISTQTINGKKVSAVQPHKFVKGNYHLLYDNGKCYFQAGKMSVPNYITKPYGDNYEGGSYRDSVTHSRYGQPPRHLSKSDYDNIVKSNPTQDELFKVYMRHSQSDQDDLFMNTEIEIPVF